jgi:hypothetical protein
MRILLAIVVNALALGCMAWTGLLVWRGQNQLFFCVRMLLEEARRQNDALYRSDLAPRSPFRGAFKLDKAVRLAKHVDVSKFGPECLRLQAEARAAYRATLRGFLPMLAFAALMSLATELGVVTKLSR